MKEYQWLSLMFIFLKSQASAVLCLHFLVVYEELFGTDVGKRGVNAVLTAFESHLFHSNGLIRLHAP